MPLCQANTKKGTRCKNEALKGSNFCQWHDNGAESGQNTIKGELELELIKQRYGLYKVIAGTLAVGIVSAALPFIIERSKVDLEAEKSRVDFVSKYTNYLERDPDAQFALVNYFSYVLPEENQRELWIKYKVFLEGLTAQEVETSRQIAEKTSELENNPGSLDDPAKLAEIEKLRNQLDIIRLQLRPIVPSAPPATCLTSSSLDKLRSEYLGRFLTLKIRDDRQAIVRTYTNKLISNRKRYEAVASQTNVPWYAVGIIHLLESSFNFQTHIHNGDPLTDRTIRFPAGRPENGDPPFDWESSAVDAMKFWKLDAAKVWNLPELLWRLERLNGLGYRKKSVCSPYLWSFSNHYNSGKYVADGGFSSTAVSKHVGAAVILHALLQQGLITREELGIE
jgi:lysozyme family protein